MKNVLDLLCEDTRLWTRREFANEGAREETHSPNVGGQKRNFLKRAKYLAKAIERRSSELKKGQGCWIVSGRVSNKLDRGTRW